MAKIHCQLSLSAFNIKHFWCPVIKVKKIGRCLQKNKFWPRNCIFDPRKGHFWEPASHKIDCRKATWAPTRKPKLSRVTSGYGEVVIPLSQIHLSPTQPNPWVLCNRIWFYAWFGQIWSFLWWHCDKNRDWGEKGQELHFVMGPKIQKKIMPTFRPRSLAKAFKWGWGGQIYIEKVKNCHFQTPIKWTKWPRGT